MTNEEYSPSEEKFVSGRMKNPSILKITHTRPKYLIVWEGKKTQIKTIRFSDLSLLNIDLFKGSKIIKTKLTSNNPEDENNSLKLRLVNVIPKRLSVNVMRTDSAPSFLKWFFVKNYVNISDKITRFYFFKIVSKKNFLIKLHKINTDCPEY